MVPNGSGPETQPMTPHTPVPLAATAVTPDELLATDDLAAAGDSAPPPAAPDPAPASTPPPSPEPANAFAGVKDSRGVEFHPAKFRLKDGKPQIDKLGRFVPLGVGRKAESDTPAADDPAGDGARRAPDSGSSLPPDEPAAAVPELTAEIGVEVAINLIQTALIVIGEDEGILDDLEKAMLRAPLLRVLQKYNLASKMTPEMEAAAAIAVIVMRRVKKPKTMGWFQSKLAWIAAWWKSRKVRRAVADPIPVEASA